jgi:hypothetical protein
MPAGPMLARVENPDGSLEPAQNADVREKPDLGDSISLEDGRHVQVTGYALDEDGHLSYLVVTEVP